MRIEQIRIYAEVLEQGIDFGDYVRQSGYTGIINNVYTKKAHGEFSPTDSIIDRIRKVKAFRRFEKILFELAVQSPRGKSIHCLWWSIQRRFLQTTIKCNARTFIIGVQCLAYL